MRRVDPIVGHVMATTLSGGGLDAVKSPRMVALAIWAAGAVLRPALALSGWFEAYAMSRPWTPSEHASMTCHCGDCLRYVRTGFKS